MVPLNGTRVVDKERGLCEQSRGQAVVIEYAPGAPRAPQLFDQIGKVICEAVVNQTESGQRSPPGWPVPTSSG